MVTTKGVRRETTRPMRSATANQGLRDETSLRGAMLAMKNWVLFRFSKGQRNFITDQLRGAE